MKLPMVEALKTVQTRKVVPISRHVSALYEAYTPEIGPVYDRAIEFRTSAVFEIRQLSRNSHEAEHLHKQAERVLIKEVYGPIEDRLHEILHKLWEDGPSYGDDISKMVEALINDMKP